MNISVMECLHVQTKPQFTLSFQEYAQPAQSNREQVTDMAAATHLHASIVSIA